ncbi:AGAMOUS-like 96 [Striga hermonthica]|uniref:AGAMOUS-like 96 n=1 Tax=Striga hermonthica TaxID=68872 RepID=A0A9N7N4S7_STRHE|nr:AGAMOUS-like 96 [Striga hermonthica]
MSRRRTKHELISNTNKRKTTFRKRSTSLVKKANELSILCGVDVGVVAHNREGGENNAVLWPSPQAFNEMLQRFLNASEVERARRMETHETNVQRAIMDEVENVAKAKRKVEMRVSQHLLAEVTKGKDLKELDLLQLQGVCSFAEEMLKKIKKREEELGVDQTNVASTSNVAPQN